MNVIISYPSFYFTDRTEDIGGESRNAWETVSRLAKNGIVCHVVGPDIVLDREYENIFVYEIKNCRYRNLQSTTRKRFRAFKFNVLSRCLIKKLCKKHDIDIIHHIKPSYPGFFSSVSNLPVPFVYGGITVKYDRSVENKSYREGGPYTRYKMRRWLRNLKDADKVILDTVAAKSHVPEELHEKTVVLNYGVEISMFHNDYPPKNEKKRVLYLSLIRKYKGADILLQAIPAVVEAYPNVEFTFVGKIMEKDFYSDLIEKLGIDKWVEFTGPVPYEKITEFYNSADVFCLPAIMDSSPNVILEAMASSLPVVSTNIMGIPEYIEDGKSGILLEAGDREALERSLIDLLSDEKKCMRLSGEARKRIEEVFSWDKHVEKLIDIYKAIR